jgi:hypothetical protein
MVDSPPVSGAIRGALAALRRAVVLRQSEQGPTLPFVPG